MSYSCAFACILMGVSGRFAVRLVAPWAKNFLSGVTTIRSGRVRGIRLFETQSVAYPFAMITGDSKGKNSSSQTLGESRQAKTSSILRLGAGR
jgi:hypothetical protein